ncbi:MAG: methylated-DNA--[protein]-cysteine S-methyltransferase [Negativicutes bacterium]|jgi:methylated-DNA-[protein]-cysteine S-methyltransferase
MDRIPTKFGEFSVWWRNGKLFAIRFPDEPTADWQSDAAPKKRELLVEWLNDYCDGLITEFPKSIAIDYSQYSDFTRRVLESVAAIPYGMVKTYSMIAREIGNPRAARAVGNSIGSNLVPVVIPCHRVVRADGAIGGFTSGVHWKKRLLNLENRIHE